MVDTPQNIQLRRFTRSITVAGLGAGPDDQANPSPTVTRSFDGVLGLGISTEPRGSPVHLSYLTLAPLLAREFARKSHHRRSPQTESLVPKGDSTGDDSSDADEKLRVRELLRGDGDDTLPGSDALGKDLTVTAGPGQSETAGPGPEDAPNERADRSRRSDHNEGNDPLPGSDALGRDLTVTAGPEQRETAGPGPGDAPDKRVDRSGRPDRWQQSPWRHGPGGAPDLTAAKPVRTVVGRPVSEEERGDPQPQRTGALPGPTPPGGAGPERGTSRGLHESTASVETTVTRATAEEPETEEDVTSSSSAASADAGHPMSSDDRRGSALTVTSGQASPTASEDESDELSELEYGDPDDANGAHAGRQKDRESVDERMIIRSDGRVNERVLDRLYEEFDRKMRLKRRREGR